MDWAPKVLGLIAQCPLQLVGGGDCSFTALLDSRVAKGAHAQGDPQLWLSGGSISPSFGLRQLGSTRLTTSTKVFSAQLV